MSDKPTPIKCCRCSHVCTEDDLVLKPRKEATARGISVSDKVCPRCGCKSYYDLTPQVAWCWASGLIEIGDSLPPDSKDGSGAIEIARGPQYALKGQVMVHARLSRGGLKEQMLVPGVPEASDQRAAAKALAEWLSWCRKCKPRGGVTFSAGIPA